MAPLFEERRDLSGGSRYALLLAVVLGAGMVAVRLADGFSLLDALAPPFLVLWLPIGLILVVQRTRIGPDFRSLRVDRDGLRVKDRVVPGKRLGRVELVHQPEALFGAYRQEVRGLRIGRTQSTYVPLFTAKPAVLVEDLRGGERPGWLLESRDPEGLVRALEQVRGSR